MDISVVLSTYNRCDTLAKALGKLSQQEAPGIQYEIIVVDNNSTDRTPEIAEGFTAADARFRYLFEARQGLSYGRNAGIRAARADAIVFTDDDVEVATDWIRRIHQALLRYPEAEYIGGRVLPLLEEPKPAWAHFKMSPFALQDLGDEPVRIGDPDRRCLIGACLAVRRRALAKAGLFSIETQRVQDGVGSTEDADWETQVWNYGGHGMYVPEIVVHSPLSKSRLLKAYHRRWHAGHGKFNARARRPELESARRWLDVPAFIYRQALQSGFECALLSLQRKPVQAFERENALLFSLGFIAERWRMQLLSPQSARRQAQVNSLAS
ncbi:MAG TPA: glycosyltransferase [Bryobacteraceae bacterium]|jgi:glycosyltransferase involved in cell wall biosynthesis|nr:glycosyltransferase [Bryobacteraceae bacterium]